MSTESEIAGLKERIDQQNDVANEWMFRASGLARVNKVLRVERDSMKADRNKMHRRAQQAEAALRKIAGTPAGQYYETRPHIGMARCIDIAKKALKELEKG